jgi:hypothetical protein
MMKHIRERNSSIYLDQAMKDYLKVFPSEACKIVDIQFAFNNAGMIKLMSKRANSLKSGNFKSAKETEN